MNIKKAQYDMRQSYLGGASGVIASGLVWLIAGIAALTFTTKISVLIFFFGGMLIHPLGILFSKIMKRSGKHRNENPLSKLAMESTFVLFIGLFIAFAVLQIKANWFYPIMLLIIGGRYVIFASVYGMKVYWVLGLILSISGIASLYLSMPFHFGALLGGTIEIVFAIIIFNLECEMN